MQEDVKAEKSIQINSEFSNSGIGAFISSSLFYWNYIAYTDCRNLTKTFIDSFNCPSELARVADAHGGAPLAFAARGKKSRVATWLLALISLHPSFHCVKTNTVKCQDNRKPFPATIHPRYKAPSLSRCLSPCQRENPTEEETPISQCYLRPLFCQILLPFHVLLWDR